MIITLANRKGGTGKTTTTVNLAAVWASQGKRVLVIDLDTQNHCALGLGFTRTGLPAGHAIHQLFQAPAGQQPSLTNWILTTPFQGLDLLPADPFFDPGLQALPTTRLRQAIQAQGLAQQYDHILIDTPPTLDGLLLSAAIAAEGLLVPFVPHYLGEVGVLQLARLFYEVTAEENPELLLLGLLPVMLERQQPLHQQILDKLARQFGKPSLLRGIRRNIQLAEAFHQQQPICHYAPRSAGTMDYTLLASELEALWEKEMQATQA